MTSNEYLDRQLEAEKVKWSRVNSELVAANEIVQSFSQQLNETKNSVAETEQTLSDLQSEVSRLTALEFSREKEINFLTGLIEAFLNQIK